jgi:hypothetical protein
MKEVRFKRECRRIFVQSGLYVCVCENRILSKREEFKEKFWKNIPMIIVIDLSTKLVS